MVRSRSMVTIVVIAVIAGVLATVAVVYAVQNILGTKQVSATANIVNEADFLQICSKADFNCDTPLTGELEFGDMFRGVARTAVFHIKNTGPIDPILIDVRIRSGDAVTFLNLAEAGKSLTGDAPNLGTFRMKKRVRGNFSNEDFIVALAAGLVREFSLQFTPAFSRPAGPLSFDVLIDAVDELE